MLLRLPAQAEPGQVAQLDGPCDGVGGDGVLVVDKGYESIVIADGHTVHPVEGRFRRGEENQEAGPAEEGDGEGDDQADSEFSHC